MKRSQILHAMVVLAACGSMLAACGSEPPPESATPAPPDNIPAAELPEASNPLRDTISPDSPVSSVPGQSAPARPGGSVPGAGSGTAPASGGGAPPAAPSPDAEPSAEAQGDEGAAVLQRASTAYGNVRSMRADFVMNYSNPLLRQNTTSRGTLYQQRPDRIALRFTEPQGDVIVGDGEYFWVYYPSVDAQQVIQSPAAASGETGVDLQAQFVGDPVRRFQYTLHGQETVGGRSAHVLTLVPRERAEYRSLKVWLDTRDALARRFEITEHNGTVRRFDLANLAVNPSIPASTFQFTPPAGARVVRPG